MKMANDRVLVRPDPKKEISEGGVFIPEKHQDAPSSGIILYSSLPEFPPGIHIFYFTYAGTEIRWKDPQDSENKEKVYHVVSGKDILFSD